METTISGSLRQRILLAQEKLLQLAKTEKHSWGQACDPDLQGKLDLEPLQGKLDFEWPKTAKSLNDELDELLVKEVRRRGRPAPGDFAPLTPDKLWLWGGPTPEWAGSMADDTLSRELGRLCCDNGVYVYGETSEHMLGLHQGFKKLLCQVNANCRTAGKLAGTEEENAMLLSQLSLKFPNVVGAMCDDFTTGFYHLLLPERFEKIYRGVKRYNEALKVYGVIYAHELDTRYFHLVQPYIDVVNLWLWNKPEILDVDCIVSRARKVFPGKPIVLGVFLHDYGISGLGQPPELMIYQLERAGVMLKKGWIEGVVFLGDREIRRWPKVAERIERFLSVDQYGRDYR